MRFEIRAGGFIVILIGLVGLSGVVFFFGVLAGNEIAKQNTPDPAQISSVFPLPSPPPAAASPAVASMAAVGPTSAPKAPNVPPIHAHAPVFTPMAANSPAAVSSAPMNTRAMAKLSTPGAPAEGSAHRHPFNIQIEAVMDRNGAQQMVNRLQSLGYPAGMETTDIDGQTWYRVRVGPYDSQDEAQEAQEKLRQQYRQKYAPH